ncbi:MAG: GNAT family N-acetyltransferase [Sandaracinaceae bacterium]|nr:GNAT family N-acetyltransferase [Sandaracinaceae bacterium]
MSLIVRPCVEHDLDRVSELAANLVRYHHEIDPQRYLLQPRVREGYRWWLGQELEKPNVVLLVAEHESKIDGYAYARLEERDWMRLLDAHGKLHDVWVEPALRGTGAAAELVHACVRALEALGAERIVLDTAWGNERARRFFEKLGFRPAMLEMMLETTR